MTTFKFKLEFEKCLKGIKTVFIKELKAAVIREKGMYSDCMRGNTVKERYERINNAEDFHDFIDKAFIWRLTKQGDNYWIDIANKKCKQKPEHKPSKKAIGSKKPAKVKKLPV